MKGPFTQEHKAKMSAAKKGRPLTPEHRAAIKQARMGSTNGRRRACVFKGVRYERIKDAAKANDMTTAAVIYYLKKDCWKDSYYI